jgi:hypothetical protein
MFSHNAGNAISETQISETQIAPLALGWWFRHWLAPPPPPPPQKTLLDPPLEYTEFNWNCIY